ncbi:hypothetical protein QYE76_002750 [Lolium multiflorum]|uniref:Reverse transcriptase Ty1/copia-type domain-containing protein n=1 Tax=Lolium multiflorum TaxID=4521 RepID=A0AAD8RP50_LOLMU|nr:hypothetical protein QYE76_002750 [Lolium multiflorum]
MLTSEFRPGRNRTTRKADLDGVFAAATLADSAGLEGVFSALPATRRRVREDLHTKAVIIRCNSTGDLYPYYPSGVSLHALTISNAGAPHLWHRRLGHPGHDALRRLTSSSSLPCNEVVCCRQPTGFIDNTRPDHVCCLNRSLYGLKQAPRGCYHRFATFVATVGFTCSKTDTSLFVLHSTLGATYLLLYVDDIILTASSTVLLERVITALNCEFAMTDMGDLHYFLGITIPRTSTGMFLSQQKYAAKILDRAGMRACTPSSTPIDTAPKLATTAGSPVADPTEYRSLVGALQYLTFTRPDIAYAIQQICLRMHDPRDQHLALVKRVIHNVKGTLGHGLQLLPSAADSLITYTEADWAGCPDTRRSTSGYGVFQR